MLKSTRIVELLVLDYDVKEEAIDRLEQETARDLGRLEQKLAVAQLAAASWEAARAVFFVQTALLHYLGRLNPASGDPVPSGLVDRAINAFREVLEEHDPTVVHVLEEYLDELEVQHPSALVNNQLTMSVSKCFSMLIKQGYTDAR